jgi:hypothetical protein
MSQYPVKVVIPIYRKELSDLERRSLNQVYTVLAQYPIVVVRPKSLEISDLSLQYPRLLFISFEDFYFDSIQGYNRLMLSSAFYRCFLDSEFILIYQLDAYIFRDELSLWCSKGYDYIGAPWLKKTIYQWPIISNLNELIFRCYQFRNKKSKQSLYNKVGNGGFSLRKVKSFYKATSVYDLKIRFYLQQKRSHLYNEDVFWATEIPEFSYPDTMEALLFSFDKYPYYSFQLTNRRLPFGCHGWYKWKMRRFWKPVIGF